MTMNNKMFKIGFFILLVLNIVLMTLFVMAPKPLRPESGRSQSSIKDEISSELGFTEEQKVRFDEMAMNHREAIRNLEGQERSLMKSFFGRLVSENTNQEKEILLGQIVQLERDKIEITYAHFEELKGICTGEQLTRFDKVLSRIVPILINSPGAPPPGGRGRPN